MKCANPRCGKEFTPKRPQQRFHDAACLLAYNKRVARARIENHQAQKAKVTP